jgi:hypothetical protein
MFKILLQKRFCFSSEIQIDFLELFLRTRFFYFEGNRFGLFSAPVMIKFAANCAFLSAFHNSVGKFFQIPFFPRNGICQCLENLIFC